MDMHHEIEAALAGLYKTRAGLDRRVEFGEGRRRVYSLDYFYRGGEERRKNQSDRRCRKKERRERWARVTAWNSIYMGD